MRILGLLYLVLGVGVLLNSFSGITGFVIYEDVDLKWGGLLSVVFVVIGILVLFTTRTSEKSELERAVVYEFNEKEKDKNRSYRLIDRALHLSKNGQISLGEFKREISSLRREEGGEELVKIVQQEYGPALHKIAESTDKKKARIAGAFLEVLEKGYRYEEEREDYRLTQEEKRKIRNAFKERTDRLSTAQRDILRKYELAYMPSASGGHQKISYKDTGYNIGFSSSPSDRRFAGLRMANDIIHLIEKCRKIEQEKTKQS